MTDNELLALLVTTMMAGVAFAGWTYTPPGGTVASPYPVLQKDQPTQEGIPYSPTVFFEKLFDVPFGYAKVKNTFANGVMTQTELQPTETTIQISSLVIQHPDDLSVPTASDVVNLMRSYLLSRVNLANWKTQGVGVLRVRRIENPYFEDDRHRNEASPSFDLVMTYKRIISQQVNYATTMTGTTGIVGGSGDVIVGE
jgi:hypothetical protein